MQTIKKNRGAMSLFMGLLVLVLLISLSGSVNAQAAIIIDGFDSGSQSLLQQGLGTNLDTVQASSALGGWRKIAAQNLTSGSSSRVFADVFADLGDDNVFQIIAADPTNYSVRMIWDGDNGLANTIDYTGLSADLTHVSDVQVADGILLTIVGWDGNDIDIRFTIYTDENNYSVATYPVRGDFSVGAYNVSLCFYEGCFQTGVGAAGPADFRNVGAIVMELVSVQQGADITIDLAFADAARDFGDLPDSYTTFEPDPLNPNTGGARHSQGNVWLGVDVDTELDANIVGDGATGDLFDDGIAVVGTDGPRWQNGTDGGAVQVTWVSPRINGHACLDGWIDWDDTGNFTGTSDNVVSGYRLEDTSGVPFVETVTFDVPSDFFSGNSGDPNIEGLANRWRIYPVDPVTGLCPVGGIEYFGYIINGEVEDYIWGFEPTAVSLQSFSAANSSSLPVYGLIGFAALAMVGMVALVLRRERKQA